MPRPKPKLPTFHIYCLIDEDILANFKAEAAKVRKPMKQLLGEIITFWVKIQQDK